MQPDVNFDEDKENEISEIRRLVEENNKILKGLRGRARASMFFSIFKWIVIVGITIGAYAFIQPFINQFLSTYQSIQENANTLNQIKNSIPDTNELPKEVTDFIKKLNF